MNKFASALRTVLVIALVGGLCVGACLAALVPGAKVIAAAHHYTGDLDEDLGELSLRTTVYDVAGNQIGQLGIENREEVQLSEVPDGLINAVIAIEDRSFYDNPGFDVSGVFRAFVENISSGEIEEGGSTITQQLVKKRILSSEQSVDRKVRELVLAFRLNERYSKNQILEQYLNTVYFGQGSYGVKTAAERFFDVELADLTVGQSALLAGLIQNPEGDNPFFYPRKATKRRAEVLRAEVEEGYISQEQADAAKAEPLPTELPDPELRPEDAWVDQVQTELLKDPRLGDTRRERRASVLEGGLQVYTTKNPTMQAQAQAAVYADNGFPRGDGFTAAMVAIDPRSGAVRAMVGGDPDFAATQLNIATDSYRQMGSTWKVITLAAALMNGYSPNDTVDGTSPCRVDGYDGFTSNSGDGIGGGTMSLRNATTGSVNCAFARLSTSVGLDKVIDTAHALGINVERPDLYTLQEVLTLTLGTIEATPLEMATVAATIAAGGVRRDPYFVQKVVDADGEVIFDEGVPAGERVMTEEAAACEMDMLRGPLESGTAAGLTPDGKDAGGKTGTTDNEWDAAFLGFTVQLAAFIWHGNPLGLVPGAGFGGEIPAHTWNRFMNAALATEENIEFPDPGPVCSRPGQRVDPTGGRGGAVPLPEPEVIEPEIPDDTQPDNTQPTTTQPPQSTLPPETTPQPTIPEDGP